MFIVSVIIHNLCLELTPTPTTIIIILETRNQNFNFGEETGEMNPAVVGLQSLKIETGIRNIN